MRIKLDDDMPDSYRASMDIIERKVDPHFLTMPLWEQIALFGYGWRKEQQEIFNNNFKE